MSYNAYILSILSSLKCATDGEKWEMAVSLIGEGL